MAHSTTANGAQLPIMPSLTEISGTPEAPHFGRRVDNWSNSNGRTPGTCNCCPFIDKFTKQVSSPGATSVPLPSLSLAKKVAAEFLGTTILIFAAAATSIVNKKTGGVESLIGLAAASGLAAMIVIFSTGHISGAHVNPSITISFAALRHFPWTQVPASLAAQLLGSISAAFLLKLIFNPLMGGGVTVPAGSCAQAFALEFIITFILMFVVTSVATDTQAVGDLAGIAVGATVTMNTLIAGATSGAAMNPVRALGPALATNNFKALWVYLTAPVLGALCGAAAYTAVKIKNEGEQSQTKPPSF